MAVKLLVLGGTKFLGRHLVEAALAGGHELTLFNRGRTDPDLFGDVERLRGDRDGDLGALEGGSWDAVVDTSGYVPRVVRASAELLRDRIEHYTFVSSISAYADFSSSMDEEAPLAELEDETSEDVSEHYGALKVACERVVADVFPGRALLVRAGLIVGPHDPTGRFTYWCTRAASGGDMLVPGPAARRVQFIHGRDLADWIVRAAEARLDGAFNAAGPVPRPTMEELVETCIRVGGAGTRAVWVDPDFLLERDVGPWMELPLWMPGEEWAGLLDADVSKAVAAGLTFRPLEETVRETMVWARDNPGQGELASGIGLEPVGLAADKEADLLEAWRGR